MSTPGLRLELNQDPPLCPCGAEASFPEDMPRRCQDCYEAWLEELELKSYLERDLI